MSTTILTGILAIVVCAAAWTDLRDRRIPNLLTVSGFCVALVLQSFSGVGALSAGLLGAGVGLLVALPLFAAGGMGGGDTKLIIAVGAFLGPQKLLVALVVTGVMGGLMALLVVMRQGTLLPALFGTADLIKHQLTLGRSGSRMTLASEGAVSVPYGVAIATGALAACVL